MKTLVIAFLIGFARLALASPFLVCDPYPAGLDQSTMPVTFIITGLAQTPISTPAFTNQDGTIQLKYDLSQVAHGSYTLTASAANVFGGTSAASLPFSFTSGVPSVPGNLRITP
jgi:hypothetical protein